MDPENQDIFQEDSDTEDQPRIDPIAESHLEGVLAEQERELRQIWDRVCRHQEEEEEARFEFVNLQRASVRTHHLLKRVRPQPSVQAWVIASKHKNPQEAPQVDILDKDSDKESEEEAQEGVIHI